MPLSSNRRRMFGLTSWIVCALSLGACKDSAAPAIDPPGEAPYGNLAVTLRLVAVATGLSQPLFVTAPAGDARVFIVEQPGRIRIVKAGTLLATPFLDIRAKVASGGERGLLSLAFHPSYPTNGLFFVNYTNLNGDTHVERYTVSGDADVADPASAKLILFVAQPYPNHNGGLVAFGPDSMLYIGMGDGGSGGDPQGHGQNRSTLLGDLLRINVNAGDPYANPSNNPFVNNAGMRGEIWAWGLRNPWRFSWDRATRLLYIADVGQNQVEEINVVPAASAGLNYGWNIMEGTRCYSPSSGCNQQNLILPVLEYAHTDGCSVNGGLVYRGTQIPEIAGHYFYGDFCSGWVRSFRHSAGSAVDRKQWTELSAIGQMSSFGEDGAGEMYVTSLNGSVFRFARTP